VSVTRVAQSAALTGQRGQPRPSASGTRAARSAPRRGRPETRRSWLRRAKHGGAAQEVLGFRAQGFCGVAVGRVRRGSASHVEWRRCEVLERSKSSGMSSSAARRSGELRGRGYSMQMNEARRWGGSTRHGEQGGQQHGTKWSPDGRRHRGPRR
jgi:hypothetical protein